MNVRKLLTALICGLLLCSFRGGLTTDQPPSQFSLQIPLGSGGFARGLDINTDGTRLARTDTAYCYIWNAASSVWVNLVTQSTMPAANFGFFPTTGTSQVSQASSSLSGGGCYEVASAPSNSSVIYIVFNGKVFVSTNKGLSFINTGFGPFVMQTNGQSPNNFSSNGRHLAVDPVNPDIVCVGTDTAGMWCATNGTNSGGATWTQVITVATSSKSYSIAFDPSTSTGGSTPTIYAGANGTGFYVSTTGVGGTFSLTSSGPATMQRMVVAPSGGVMWAIDGSDGSTAGNLWQFASGAWTEITAAGARWHSIAVDPANVNRILVGTPGGSIDIGTVSGATVTWQTPVTSPLTPLRTATDVPWLATTNENFMTNGDMVFDPSLSNTVLFAEGIGVWSFNPPGSGSTFTVNSNTAGIEQLVTNGIVAPNSKPIIAVWDRLLMSPTNLSAYPAVQGANNGYNYSIQGGWAIDYASSNHSFIAVHALSNIGSIGDMSGSSSDGGQTWLPFNNWNATVVGSTSNIVSGTGSAVKITVPSTVGLNTWTAANGAATPGACACIVMVRALTNGPAATNLPNGYFEITVNDSTHITLSHSTFNAAQQSPNVSFIIAVITNPLSNYNGAFTINSTAAGAGGVVQVILDDGNSTNMTGGVVCNSGVTGTTEANGCFIATFVSSGHINLQDTVFVNAYTGGGVLGFQDSYGGSIAASSPNNIVVVGANGDSNPYCTTDGGGTWTQLVFPGVPITQPVSTATWATNQVTFTTSGNTNIAVGQQFFVGGVSVAGYNKALSGGVPYTAVAGTSGTTIVATLATNPGSSGSGGVIIPVTGWDHAYFSNTTSVAADRVTANTIFAYNYLVGTFVITNCATPVLQSSTLLPQTNAGLYKIKSVPNNANNLLFTAGAIGAGNANHPSGTSLNWSNNGGGNWHSVTSTGQVIEEPLVVDAGAIKPGNDYPTVYFVGWLNNVYGIYRSTSSAAAWASCTTTCSVTWTKVGDYPAGYMSGTSCIAADQKIWNRYYICRGGNGAAYGQQNFLLKRDLDPASNDNDPMWLEKAA